MIKDVLESFKDNIRERITNPFLGTFVLVWIVHNWQIVYTFFFFDNEYKLQAKIHFFKHYWTEHNFIWNLICVAFITMGALLITYAFLGFSRLLSNYFENIIIPLVYKWSKGKIYTAEQYNTLVEENKKLAEKVENERKSKNEVIKERDALERIVYAPPVETGVKIIGASNSDFDLKEKTSLTEERISDDKDVKGIEKSKESIIESWKNSIEPLLKSIRDKLESPSIFFKDRTEQLILDNQRNYRANAIKNIEGGLAAIKNTNTAINKIIYEYALSNPRNNKQPNTRHAISIEIGFHQLVYEIKYIGTDIFHNKRYNEVFTQEECNKISDKILSEFTEKIKSTLD